MTKLHSIALAVVAVLVAGSAHADTFTINGTLAPTDGTFNRPLTLTSLSAVGTAVYYDAFTFGGVTAGAYDFRMTATFDSFLALYAGGFNPASPLTNLVALNDDFGGVIAAGSGFTFTLNATSIYTVVSTSFSNATTGAYATTVTSAVPEVQTYGLMAMGLALVGTAVRRRLGA